MIREVCLDESTLASFLDGGLTVEAAGGVEEHLDACSDCRVLVAEIGRSLGRSLDKDDDVVADEESGEALALQPGVSVGRYRVTGPLGSGSMGVVYAAYDPQLGRRLALKLVRPHGGPSMREQLRVRVLREAQAMARLAHPNVVAIHDVGTFGSEVFLVMELLERGTLASVLAKGSLGWREVLALFREAGQGLAAAHAVGIVHRDFKPENVLIGVDGRPRVGDFGLARAPAPDAPPDLSTDTAGADPAPTVTRGLLGTPAYMAPEQLRGEPAGPASDVFGFAVALYEALYGERPFEGRSLADLSVAIEAGRMRRAPSGSGVPRAIRDQVVRALAPKADARPTMRELLTSLDHAQRPRTAARIGLMTVATGAVALFAWGAMRASVARSEPGVVAEIRRMDQPASDARATALELVPSAVASAVAASVEAPPPLASSSSTPVVAIAPIARKPVAAPKSVVPPASASAAPAREAATLEPPPVTAKRPLFDEPY